MQCPICMAPVLTGPTTCRRCSASLSLSPRKEPHISESPASMQLSGATSFFDPRSLEQDVSPISSQESHLHYTSIRGASDSEALLSSLSAIEESQEAICDRRVAEVQHEPRVGQQLGNYQLIRPLGKGGFAEVYLGRHLHLETLAAIKVLHTLINSQTLEQFRQEARTIARLDHPHIVRILDFGVMDGSPYLVMVYAAGGTLRHRHSKGQQLSLATVLSYVDPIAQALHYIHEQKLVHRDVKPENILQGSKGVLWLSDFGIASVAHATASLTGKDQAGTPAYMAPEQIRRKPIPASDQYALAVMVYEWLCGKRPFEGSLWEVFQQHLSVPPPALRKYVPSIPFAVEHVVLKALSKDPGQRFATVQAFALALKEATMAQ